MIRCDTLIYEGLLNRSLIRFVTAVGASSVKAAQSAALPCMERHILRVNNLLRWKNERKMNSNAGPN